VGDDRYWHPEIQYMCPQCRVLVDCFEPANGYGTALEEYARGFVTVHDQCQVWMLIKAGEEVRVLRTREEIVALIDEEHYVEVERLLKNKWMEPEEVARAARARIRALGKGANP
jgi:hypothetical protein